MLQTCLPCPQTCGSLQVQRDSMALTSVAVTAALFTDLKGPSAVPLPVTAVSRGKFIHGKIEFN